ncbi:ABC transporter permease [Mesomycoplasma lagogenitalium]|uniref:ABC transporter permease n=1 Tax=Mesomycoplasma lagogenitalium TaxID=171286 RepID=A0ABY8LUT9_9BACT|nr:ABC transporter permease [Mesomycoplasma lagogenitalium]WGI36995.1 ABC transporter permease [Mesomycoplasma lagogenitalium]
MINKLISKAKVNLNPRLSLSLVYIIFSIIFILLPMVLLLVKAVSPLKTDEEEIFDNYLLIKQPGTWIIMWRSVSIGLVTALICLIIALPYAFYVSTSKSRAFKIYSISLIVSPLIIFTIAKTFSLRALFVTMFDEASLNSYWFMLVGLVFLNLPFMIIPLYTVFKDMPKNILEASADLGYNRLQTLFKVVLPYGLKAIFSGIALVFLMAATSIIISDKLLPNGGQNQLIGNLINLNANPSNPFDLARSSSLVLITILVMLGIYAIVYFFPILILKLKGVKNV